MTTRGIVFFGVNNSRVNYLQLAIIASRFAKANMGVKTALISDTHSIKWALDSGINLTAEFSDVVEMDLPELFSNNRQYKDTRYYFFEDKFRNESRASVYDLSPYDETLLVDCDYLICSPALNSVWGCDEEVMINRDAIDLNHTSLNGDEFRLNAYGIKMYWATLIYFKKTEKAKLLFKLVEHIKENWDFYKLSYDFPGGLFRNDYAFSIAIHILNGGVDDANNFPPLPYSAIVTSLDTDQLYKVNSNKSISLFVNDKKENWKFTLSRLNGVDVHCMNKLSILNQAEQILEVVK